MDALPLPFDDHFVPRVCPHSTTVNCGPCPQCNPDLPFGIVIQPTMLVRGLLPLSSYSTRREMFDGVVEAMRRG